MTLPVSLMRREVMIVDRTVLLGRTVKEIRMAKGLTQRELADLTDLNVLTISQIETDRRGLSANTLQVLADALEVPFSYFYLLSDRSTDPLVRQFQRTARKVLGIKNESKQLVH